MAGVIQAVFDLIPDGCQLQASLDRFIQLGAAFLTRKFQAIGEISTDAHRQDDGPCKDHAHFAAQGDDIQSWVEDILPIDQDASRSGFDFGQIIETVQAAQQRGLAAARRPEEDSNRFFARSPN